MKNLYKLFLAVIFFVFAISTSLAQIPTYTLTAKNFLLRSLNHPDDALEFDVYLLHTNPEVTIMEYAQAQYNFAFNANILTNPIPSNPNDTSQMSYKIIGSDFIGSLKPPRNPQIGTGTNPTQSLLKLSWNLFEMTGVIISSQFPGTKIVRMRLWNKTASFNLDTINLRWRNPPITTFMTKIFCIVGITITDVTTPQMHTVENNINPLPVELASFTSNVNRNNVTLNWATLNEINNSGFEISRQTSNVKGQTSNVKGQTSSDWKSLGFIQGHGTTSSHSNYSYEDKNLTTGIYNYRLKQIDFNGNFEYFYLSNDLEVGVPGEYELSQNYPNPFNPKTIINYSIPSNVKGQMSNVKLTVFDLVGKEIATLVNEKQNAGYYSIEFDASNLSSGIYFYKLEAGSTGEAGDFIETKRMMLLK